MPTKPKPISAAELNKMITECAKQLSARQRIAFAQSTRHGANSDEAIAAGERAADSENELFDLIGLVRTASRRAALVKKHGLGWKLGEKK